LSNRISRSVAEVQKKYEILSNIVSEYNGKIHGFQSHIVGTNNNLQLIVYYEIPLIKRRSKAEV